MKKVIIFGSTGSIGQHLLQQADTQNFEVTAFCRNRTKLDDIPLPTPIHIIEGDVLNPVDVSKAIANHDLVIITLGAGKDRKSKVRSQGTQNIIAAMSAHGIKRLICQTTLGAGDSNDNLNFFWKRIMFGWFLKDVFIDHELQEEYVKGSALQWTIVRPSAFTDGALTKSYRHGFSPSQKQKGLNLKISRADVADFLWQQTQSTQYLFKTPGVSC